MRLGILSTSLSIQRPKSFVGKMQMHRLQTAMTYHEKVLNPILNTKATPGAYASALVNSGMKDSKKLDDVFRQMPGVRNELLAAMLHEDPGLWPKMNAQSQEAFAPDAGFRGRITDAVESDAAASKAAQPQSPTAHGVAGLRGAEAANALVEMASPLLHTMVSPGAMPLVRGAGTLAGLAGVNPLSVLRVPMNRGALIGGANALSE